MKKKETLKLRKEIKLLHALLGKIERIGGQLTSDDIYMLLQCDRSLGDILKKHRERIK